MNEYNPIGYIARKTGLTGVESKNILRHLEEMNVDPFAVDWKTIGEDLYGYGHRYKGVKEKLANMYGIGVQDPMIELQKRYEMMETDSVLEELVRIFEGQSDKSIAMDLNINAKKVFSPFDQKGVEFWKKNINICDILGVDTIYSSEPRTIQFLNKTKRGKKKKDKGW